MNLHINTTQLGEQITATIHFAIVGRPMNGQLSGPIAYALYDGLLWWAFNRKLEGFLAAVVPPVQDIGGLQSVGYRIDLGERLHRYVFTSNFHNADGEALQRIFNTIERNLPQLAPLTIARPDLATEHAELGELFALIRDRIAHQGVAGHGLADMLKPAKAA